MSKRIVAALMAGIGLGVLVAGIAILVWWSTFEKDRPMQVASEAEKLETLLEDASYITLYRGERPVTLVAPRNAEGLEQWLMEDAAELAATGREVRLIMVPSGHGGAGENATIVDLWMNRDIGLLREWFSMRAEHWTGVGLERANATPQRMEVLAEAEAFKRALMRAVSRNGEDTRWPVLIWRDGAGQMALCLCNTPSAMNAARSTLGLPSREVVAVVPSMPYGSDGMSDLREGYEDEGGDRGTGYEDNGTEAYGGYDDDDDEVEHRDKVYPRLTEPSENERYAGEGRERRERERETRAPTPSPRLPGDVRQEPPAQTTQRPRVTVTEAPQQPATPRPRRETNTEAPKAQKDAESLFY